uniref:Uncharacterized protein n=1 Tax=Varanus komodoensis TaxID=61221 RepID=A0A8D2INJ8_VARKO
MFWFWFFSPAEQVQEELDVVLGSSTSICYEDRKILPFTNAVLHETQRHSSPNAVGTVHTKVRLIDTIVLPNLFSVHYDPEEWETPRKFNPGHFLDKDGNFLNKYAFLIFMAGVRVCLGEKIAPEEVSLFISFEVTVETIPGFLAQPQPFKICAVPH